jgi:hypothetical protein
MEDGFSLSQNMTKIAKYDKFGAKIVVEERDILLKYNRPPF